MENKVYILFEQYRDYSVRLEVIGVYTDFATAEGVARGLSPKNPDLWQVNFSIQEWVVEG